MTFSYNTQINIRHRCTMLRKIKMVINKSYKLKKKNSVFSTCYGMRWMEIEVTVASHYRI